VVECENVRQGWGVEGGGGWRDETCSFSIPGEFVRAQGIPAGQIADGAPANPRIDFSIAGILLGFGARPRAADL
jgi:hypothetical protein